MATHQIGRTLSGCFLGKINTFLVVLALAALVTEASASEKEQSVQKVLSIMGRLAALAPSEAAHQGEKDFSVQVRNKVNPLLTALTPDELGKVAVISWTLFSPANAEDVGYDEVYYAAYWDCINLLSQKEEQDNYYALIFVRDHSYLDGGERLSFDTVFDQFEKNYRKKHP